MNLSKTLKKGKNGVRTLREKMRFYFHILLVIIFTIASIGYAPVIEVQATANGTADGMYDFDGTVGAYNSAGAGFATFSDKFVINNGFTIDPGTTQLYTTNFTDKAQETLIIKAEGGNVCKTFTFKDLGLSLYPNLSKLTFNKLSLVVKDTNGGTLGSHAISSNKEISGYQDIHKLSTLLNGSTEFNYHGVASLEITWQFDAAINGQNTAPSNLNFENITIANVSATAPDSISPTISDGTISVSNISSSGIRLDWTKATDNITAQNDLEYRVYQSSSNNIDTVSNIEANGMALGNGFSKDLATINVTDLSPSTTYYFNIIVKDAAGNKSVYTMQSVTTVIPANAPTVTTDSYTSLKAKTVTLLGNVTSDGNASITERGIVFGTSANPTTANGKVTVSGTTGTFNADLSSLQPNTTYHYRAFATNAQGTSYGSDKTFITLSLSDNANLSNLTLSAGTLSPAFSSGTTSYTASVPNAVSSITVTPTIGDSLSTLTLNGASAISGVGGNISLFVGSNTISTVVKAEDGTTKTYTITVTRAAAPTYTIGAIGNQTFTVLTTGYTSGTQETKTLTITNTGTGNLADVAVALSGTNASSFEITQPITTSLSSSGSTTFTVKSKDGLAAGTYTATVTVSATNLTPVTFTVTQVVNAAPTYTIGAIGDQTFTSLTAGYPNSTQETKPLTITNTGTGNLSNVAVGLSGPNAGSFEITQPIATSLPSAGNTTFTVKAKDGLAAGTYTATVTVSATNLTPVTFTVTQVVNAAPTYTIGAIGDQTFTSLTAGYPNSTQETKPLTITNTGTGNLSNVAVGLSGPNASSFEITQPLVTGLPSASNTTFTVKAKDGLAAGTYTATVTVSATNLTPVTFTVTQVVNAAPTYTIDAIGNQSYTALTTGYMNGTQETKTLTITNTGTGNLTNVGVALSGTNASDFDITQPIATSLPSPGSTTFTVKAKDGLATGTYTATVTVSATNLTPVTFTVTQEVNAVPTYTINAIGNQTFTALTTGYTSGTQETKTLTITNTGTGSMANVAVALSGTNASSFEITQPIATSLSSSGSTTFTVKAKDGLAAGAYTATVTVSATNLTPMTFTVTQVVKTVSVTAPGVPTNVMATAGDSQATVSFDAPTNNGGSAITGYTVKVYVAGVEQPTLAKTGASNPIIVTGLTNGAAYTFKVFAKNGVGSSGESVASSVVTPVAPITPYPTPNSWPTPPPTNSGTTTSKIQVALEIDGANPLETTTVEIERTKHANGEITDFVALLEANAKVAIEKAKQIGNNIVRIVIPDVHDEVGKVIVEIPKQSLQLLRENGLSLEIATENGLIAIPHSSMEGIDDKFYFRLVPVKKESERQAIEERARAERLVREALQSNDVHVVARPMTIETNMPSRPVQVTLPLKGVKIPTDAKEREAFLKQLAVFIEHSDGEKKVVIPEVVTMTKGELGLRFTVEKFSTFTIIQVNKEEETKPSLEVKEHESYIKGFPDGTFGPEKNVTRAQVVTMIARILGYTDGTVNTAPFKDIPSDHYAAGAIAFVKERGIMNGDVNGNFRASENITRAQMATVVANYKQLPIEENLAITFNDTKGHWAQWIIEANRVAGIINGRQDGSFAPDEHLTRAQAVVMMNRMFERGPLQGVTTPSFPDVKATHWAFKEIEEAAKSHAYFIDEDENEQLSK